MQDSIDVSKVKDTISKYQGKKGILIPLLQEVQSIYGYVPKEAVDVIASDLSIYPVDIYGILTFYAQFYLEPRGKNIVRVCLGTACHVMGGKDIFDYLADKLGIEEGGTTEDGLFTIERVACLGCCGMAPVVAVNDDFYGGCTIQQMDALLDTIREENNKNGG